MPHLAANASYQAYGLSFYFRVQRVAQTIAQ